jgi:hypothetical protein
MNGPAPVTVTPYHASNVDQRSDVTGLETCLHHLRLLMKRLGFAFFRGIGGGPGCPDGLVGG